MHDKAPGLNPEFERVCEILATIAKTFPEDSEQVKAIKEAAEAYIFLQLHLKLRNAYEAYRQMSLDVLTDEQEQHLREMGIDPDED
jgi:hypothetical protein